MGPLSSAPFSHSPPTPVLWDFPVPIQPNYPRRVPSGSCGRDLPRGHPRGAGASPGNRKLPATRKRALRTSKAQGAARPAGMWAPPPSAARPRPPRNSPCLPRPEQPFARFSKTNHLGFLRANTQLRPLPNGQADTRGR